MKLVKVNPKKVRIRTKTNIRVLIEEFINGEVEACEIAFAEGEYKSASICTSTWNAAIKRYGFVGVRAYTNNGHSYIQKISPEDSVK